MKKFEITEQQIRQAYDAACDVWKQRIKEWFPELYKQQSGWYKDINHPKWFAYIDYENDKAYGINAIGGWFETNNIEHFIGYEIVEDETEVFERLKEEAIRRGFVEGAKHNTFERDNHYEHECKGAIKMGYDTRLYPENKNTLYFADGGGLIFKDGQWAEIVSTPEQPKEYITIDNHKYKLCKK